MKRTHWLIAVVAVAVIIGAVVWLAAKSQSFQTPEECIQAFYSAAKDADAKAYLHCLDETLRAKIEQRYPDSGQLQEYLQTSMQNVMNWVQLGDPTLEAEQAIVSMEETRKQANQQIRIQYKLARSRGGWRITAMKAPRNIPTVLPYGIHEEDVFKKSGK